MNKSGPDRSSVRLAELTRKDTKCCRNESLTACGVSLAAWARQNRNPRCFGSFRTRQRKAASVGTQSKTGDPRWEFRPKEPIPFLLQAAGKELKDLVNPSGDQARRRTAATPCASQRK